MTGKLERKIFDTGTHYTPKSSFMSGPSTFVRGEILRFESDGYSPYDDTFVYTFHSQSDGKTKYWLLHRTDLSTSWQELFEPLAG